MIALLLALLLPAPGTYDPTATVAQVCTLWYARAHRKVPYRVRDRVYDRYSITRGHRRGWRIDHLTPIELGGTNAEDNLRPQPYAESKVKDRLEDQLHAEVCAGTITLPAARAEMLRLWKR